MKKFILKIKDQEYWRYAESLDFLLKEECEKSIWKKNKDLIEEGELDILTDGEIEKINLSRVENIDKIKKLNIDKIENVSGLKEIIKVLIELI